MEVCVHVLDFVKPFVLFVTKHKIIGWILRNAFFHTEKVVIFYPPKSLLDMKLFSRFKSLTPTYHNILQSILQKEHNKSKGLKGRF